MLGTHVQGAGSIRPSVMKMARRCTSSWLRTEETWLLTEWLLTEADDWAADRIDLDADRVAPDHGW